MNNAYPGLWRATKELAYDNGVINRLFSEEQVCTYAIGKLYDLNMEHEMGIVDAHLMSLDDATLNELCCGECAEDPIPGSLDEMVSCVLNELFDNLVPR